MTYRTARRLTAALLALVTIAVLLAATLVADEPAKKTPAVEVDKLAGTPHRQLVSVKPEPLPGCEVSAWQVAEDHKTVTAVWDICPGTDKPVLRPGSGLLTDR